MLGERKKIHEAYMERVKDWVSKIKNKRSYSYRYYSRFYKRYAARYKRYLD